MSVTPQRLILASQSSGRRELLEQAGYEFSVQPSDVDEPSGTGVTDIRQFVQQVSWLKAAAVAPTIDEGLVLAADSVSWTGREVIGKPVDAADARRILTILGGTDHELWTGVTLWRRPDNLQIVWQEASIVRFVAMSDDDMDRYLQTRRWQGCSGGYTVQKDNDPYVRVIEGSFSNVIGLPMETLDKVLSSVMAIENEHQNR